MNECRSNYKKEIPIEQGNEKKEEINKKNEESNTERRVLDNKIIMDSFESYNFKNEKEKTEFVINTTKLFLNDRGIEEINNLVIYEKLEELYLQRNYITTVENLNYSSNLEILSLHFNNIKEIKGIKHLTNLKVLDLSENFIINLEIENIPKSVEFLYLYENPFFKELDLIKYRFECINYFSNIIILDSMEVADRERLVFFGRKKYIKDLFERTMGKSIKVHYE
jgi:Leucine-rich repeat (LRR) protein